MQRLGDLPDSGEGLERLERQMEEGRFACMHGRMFSQSSKLLVSCISVESAAPMRLLNLCASPFPFDSSVFGKMDKHAKREYLNALEIVPDLVLKETPKINFLRTDDFDAGKAAHRLAFYWKIRKSTFGDRWLLPMTQSGTGALSPDLVVFLRCGALTMVPSSTEAPVALCDWSRMHVGASEFDLLAILFYYMTTCWNNAATQIQGVSVVHVVTSNGRNNMLWYKEAFQGLAALPLRIKQTLVVQAYEPGKQHLVEYMAFQRRRLIEFNTNQRPPVLKADSLAGTRKLLESYGLDRQSLPDLLGGNFRESQIDEWIRTRISLEDAMGSAPLVYIKSRAQRGTSDMILKKRKNESGSVDHKQDQRERNALYSRRVYHKRKLTQLTLQQQVDCEKARVEASQLENRRLQSLLSAAHQIVVQLNYPPQEVASVVPFFLGVAGHANLPDSRNFAGHAARRLSASSVPLPLEYCNMGPLDLQPIPFPQEDKDHSAFGTVGFDFTFS
jgi:hypothetical protein